ncbi:MAG: TolC family protein [Planctomycetes bacterium]|nr:TolC family protein [Planctomycetota bacterium]
MLRRFRTHCLPVLALVAGLGGCQTYEPRPLDLPAHRATWENRAPGDEEVRRFADRLGRLDDDAPDRYDPSDGLALAEAELLALVYNPDLRLARQRAGVVTAVAEVAGLPDDPVISANVLRITESVPDRWVVTAGLAITIPISGRLDVEKERAGAEAAAALEVVAADEWSTVAKLRLAWLAWSADRLEAEATVEIITRLDSVVASTSRLAEAGELARTEATLFALEQDTLRATLADLEGRIAAHEQTIRSLLGLAPAADVELQPTLKIAEPPGTAREQVDRIGERNLQLDMLRTRYDVAEHALDLEIRKQIPDLTLGPAYELDEGQSRIGFLAGLPIPILNANKQGIAEARAERELARAAFETGYERLVARHAIARSRLGAARDRRKLLSSTVVPLADRQVDDARTLVELGEGSALVLLESLSRAHEVKLRLVDARRTEADAIVEIAELLGPDKSPIDSEEESP